MVSWTTTRLRGLGRGDDYSDDIGMYDDRPDIAPLERAVQRLEEGLERYEHDTSDLQIRDGLIQRFEFTYEVTYLRDRLRERLA